MVADEKPPVVGDVGIAEVADDIIVEKLDGVVAGKAAAGDHAETDIGVLEWPEHVCPLEPAFGPDDDGEAERRAFAVFALDREAFVAVEKFLKQFQVFSPPRRHRRQFLKLLKADGGVDFLRAHVVAGNDEAVSLGEDVVPGLEKVDIVRHVANPAMRPDGAGERVGLGVVGDQHAAFTGGDMVREEKAERADVAEGTGFFAAQFGVERLAIVFEEIQAVVVGEGADDVQRRRIAEDGNGDDGLGFRAQCRLQLGGVDVERVQLYIDEAEPEAVLLQRMKGGGP